MDREYFERYESLSRALYAQMACIHAKGQASKKKQMKYIALIQYFNNRDCFKTWNSRKRAYQKARLKKLETELRKQYDALPSKPATFLDYVYTLVDLNAFSKEDIDLWCSIYLVAVKDVGYEFTAYAPKNHRKAITHGCHTYYEFAKWIIDYPEKVQSNDRYYLGYYERYVSAIPDIVSDNYIIRARERSRYLLRYFVSEDCFSLDDIMAITVRLGVTKERFFDVVNTIRSASKKK